MSRDKHEITYRSVDIFEFDYAEPWEDTAEDTQVTYGDGNGNALLIGDILRLTNLLDISQNDYEKLRNIYQATASDYAPRLAQQKPDPVTKKNEHEEYERKLNKYKNDILEFAAILDRCQVKTTANKKKLFRLIGDVLADRGANDLYTLFLLYKLFPSDLHLEMLLGNHDQDFLYSWATNFKSRNTPNISAKQTVSHAHLHDLIKKKIIRKEMVDHLVENYYLPNLRLLSYSIDGNKISLFTHAPVKDPLLIIKSLAKHYAIPFDEENFADINKDQLVDLINKINSTFLEIVMGENGKAEFIKIHEQFLAPKSEALDTYMKTNEAEVEYNFFCAISQIFENARDKHAEHLKPDERLKRLLASVNLPSPKNEAKEKQVRIFKILANKFPGTTHYKITQALRSIPLETEGEEYEKSVAEIFRFIPLELIELLMKYKLVKHFKLQSIFDLIPDLKQKVEKDASVENPEKIIAILNEIIALAPAFKDYQKRVDQKVDELNYQHAPFAPLLWEHYRENFGTEFPTQLKDGTEIVLVHGHDSGEPTTIKSKHMKDLNSRLGMPGYSEGIEKLNHSTMLSSNEEDLSKNPYSAKAYINSDQLPKEPDIAERHRLELVAGNYLRLCEDYAKSLLEPFQETLDILKKGKERTQPLQDEIAAILKLDLKLGKIEKKFCDPSIYSKHIAFTSLVVSLKHSPEPLSVRLDTFKQNFNRCKKEISDHRSGVLKYPVLALTLMALGTVMTGIVVGLAIIGVLALRSKYNRKVSFNFLRSNGDIFVQNLEKAIQVEEARDRSLSHLLRMNS